MPTAVHIMSHYFVSSNQSLFCSEYRPLYCVRYSSVVAHVNEGSEFYLPPTRTFIHKWNNPSCLYSPAAQRTLARRAYSFPLPA